MSKQVWMICIGFLSITLISCNKSEFGGFNAPTGTSIVTFQTVEEVDQLCNGNIAYGKASVQILAPNSVTGELEPKENIFGQLFARGLGIYVKSPDAEILEPVASQVVLIDSGSLEFTTNRRGLYEFVFGIVGPPPGDSFDQCVDIFLGVSSSAVCITVSCPEED